MLDPIISTMGIYYRLPVCLPPLDPDPDSNGSPSDHLFVVMSPINTIDNKCARTARQVTVRPLRKSGMAKMKNWMVTQEWTEILREKNMDTKSQLLNQMVLEKLDEFCPEKWWWTLVSDQLKRLDRRRRRQFRLNRRSRKYKKLQRLFKRKVSEAKRLFKKKLLMMLWMPGMV